MEEKVRKIYDKFNNRRKKLDVRKADMEDMEILEELNKEIEKREK